MTRIPAYNLVDEPWIPCVLLADGQKVELGIHDVLCHAHKIREISDPSPLVTITLHRLLLAVLHRNFGPATPEDWSALWEHGSWDAIRLDAYLDQWHSRFDLFDERYPFYQTPEIEFCYETSVAEIVHGFTLGNYATLFDHHRASDPPQLSPAQAARYLVAFQSFAPGGLITYRSQHGEPANPFKYAKAGLLAKAAVSLLTGDNLFQTLMLNLLRYDREDGVPFEFMGEDLPAWERDAPTQAVDRRPNGYLDLLTWQSRRMRLHPEIDQTGRITVSHVVRMKGYQLPTHWYLANGETMVAFRRNRKPATGESPWPELAIYPERALWRDSASLFQAVEDQNRPPRISEWVAGLVDADCLDRSQHVNLDILGMSIDRANIFLWRHERLPLPLAYVQDRNLFDRLRQALDLTEQVGRLFSNGFDEIERQDGRAGTFKVPRPLRVYAAVLASPDDDQGANPDEMQAIIKSLAPGRVYWSRLEAPFKRFLEQLAGDRIENEYGEIEHGTVVLANWAETLRRTAWATFHETIDGADSSARGLKATARAERAFSSRLKQILEPFAREREEDRDEQTG
ncbi:type I-E CRISPR-associated protein Cse1/CasA [Nitrolancea hollandica]|uniref:type I-E CRISPR-associated protein Cse1/CasA n=1 Tax=Nitrolancea hollandica TaxID=1206749 RepID=UPI00031B2158|nr:type I-E CRISPR-associated protein Cse1/CasA [Nitrolancea hollandica]